MGILAVYWLYKTLQVRVQYTTNIVRLQNEFVKFSRGTNKTRHPKVARVQIDPRKGSIYVRAQQLLRSFPGTFPQIDSALLRIAIDGIQLFF